jgi:hypothetical protein
MTRKRPAQLPEYAVSDEAAAYIADALSCRKILASQSIYC